LIALRVEQSRTQLSQRTNNTQKCSKGLTALNSGAKGADDEHETRQHHMRGAISNHDKTYGLGTPEFGAVIFFTPRTDSPTMVHELD
jgi:hypothetical protein